MTVIKGFVITILSGCCFGLTGGVMGYLLGIMVPDYYRIVFHIPPDAKLDPTKVGLGLGLTQGAIAGLVVGVVIVIIVAWYELQQSKNVKSSAESP